MTLSADIVKLLPEVARHRRALHRIPELAWSEVLTQGYITGELNGLGLKCKKLGTGVVCDLPGRNKKLLVALRADMDGLAIQENGCAEYKSVHRGVMHACGHDGHMAMLLTLAGYFKENKPRHNLRLIFQPAEEGAAGAERLIEKGVLKGVDRIFALHLSPALKIGEIALSAGAVMAGMVEFDIELTGAAAHCAEREKGADAVLAGALFITRMRELMRPYSGNNLFHVGKAVGGGARNVVAPDMKLCCTFRFFDGVKREEIMLKLAALLNKIKDETGVDNRLTVTAVYPVLYNNTDAVEYVKPLVDGIVEAAPSFEHLLQPKVRDAPMTLSAATPFKA